MKSFREPPINKVKNDDKNFIQEKTRSILDEGGLQKRKKIKNKKPSPTKSITIERTT